jgi:predicted transcriptional regulator
MKAKTQIIAGAISLVALLVYTLVHTGGLLARYVDPPAVGFVAALGIEVAIVSLSLRIGDLKRSNQNYGFFFFVLVSVVIVSALANVAEGFLTAEGVPLTIENVQRLDVVQAVIGLAATGLISLIVLALSEIIGSDVQTIAAAAEKDRRKRERETEINEPGSIEIARQADLEQDKKTREDKIAAMLDIWRDNPTARPSEIYRPLGIARGTYYNYVNELLETGVISKNGDGKILVQE